MNTVKGRRVVTQEGNPKNDNRGTLLSLEMELSLLEQDLNRFETLYASQEIKNKRLEYNIDFLKQDKIVTSIKGYRESLSELKNGIDILTKLEKQVKNAKKQIEKKQISHNYYLEKVELEYKQDKVLQFRGRDDKEKR